MKKLEELGISPAPWTTALNAEGEYALDVVATDYTEVAECINTKDARLIAASPELYECLREAVIYRCTECHEANDYESDIEIEWQMCRDCPARKWRAALAKAAGESEVKDA